MIKYYYRSLRSEALVESAEYKRGAWVYAPPQVSVSGAGAGVGA